MASVHVEQGVTGYLKEWEIFFGIREMELHSLMRMIIAGETGGQKPTVPAQIINGFPTGGMVHNAGIRRPFFFDDPKFSELAAARLGSITTDDGYGSRGRTHNSTQFR